MAERRTPLEQHGLDLLVKASLVHSIQVGVGRLVFRTWIQAGQVVVGQAEALEEHSRRIDCERDIEDWTVWRVEQVDVALARLHRQAHAHRRDWRVGIVEVVGADAGQARHVRCPRTGSVHAVGELDRVLLAILCRKLHILNVDEQHQQTLFLLCRFDSTSNWHITHMHIYRSYVDIVLCLWRIEPGGLLGDILIVEARHLAIHKVRAVIGGRPTHG